MAETTTTTEAAVLQVPTTLKSLLEALFFAAQEPLSVKQLQAMYDYRGLDGESRQIQPEEIARIVDELNGEYVAADKPYRIVQIAGGYQFATLPIYAEWLGRLYREQARRKLSQSSIETLAIIAYRQPVTKPEIESIRGVNCDYVLKTLLEKELATIVGRATTVGRPLLYGTTKEFLKHFGLNDIADLPRPREIQEILGESQFESERRMLEAQQGLQEKKEEDFKSRLPHIPKRKPGLDEEVKIIPRKRIREISVRESGAHDTAAEEETPLDAGETAAPLEVEPTSDVSAPVQGEQAQVLHAIPEAEGNRGAPSGKAAQEEISADTESALPDAFQIPGPISQAGAEVPADAFREEQVPPTPPDVIPDNRSPNLVPDEIPQIGPEEIPPILDEGSAPVREEALEGELKETEALPMPSAQLEDSPPDLVSGVEREGPLESEGEGGPDSVETESTALEGSSHVDSPFISGPPAAAGRPLPDVPVATPAQRSTVQPKSRWQAWKEKIQGFIRKLFG